MRGMQGMGVEMRGIWVRLQEWGWECEGYKECQEFVGNAGNRGENVRNQNGNAGTQSENTRNLGRNAKNRIEIEKTK